MKTKTRIRSGGYFNHGLVVKSAVRACGYSPNHGVVVKSAVRAGGYTPNHGVVVKSAVRACGAVARNHGAGLRS